MPRSFAGLCRILECRLSNVVEIGRNGGGRRGPARGPRAAGVVRLEAALHVLPVGTNCIVKTTLKTLKTLIFTAQLKSVVCFPSADLL